MKKVVVKAPAKLNLALAVTGLAENGYHTVDMIMQAVGIFETVEVLKSTGYSLRLPGSRIPANDKNTATRAAQAFFYETGLLAGAEIIVHKAIPTRAGMAGGSADAAAVLVGLNELYGARLTLQQLCSIGAKIGADVPFSLMGGTARAQGIGEVLSPLTPLAHCWFCVAMPYGGGVSTPAAYARFDEQGSPFVADISGACGALDAQNLHALAPYMQNMLEPANGDDTTAALRRQLDAHGALASMMTGSGAAVFGLFEQEAAAQAAAHSLAGVAKSVFVTQPVAHGPLITERG